MINSIFEVTNELTRENIIKTADKIVHFGWKEAIPITQIKKSLIGRLFEGILDNYCYF